MVAQIPGVPLDITTIQRLQRQNVFLRTGLWQVYDYGLDSTTDIHLVVMDDATDTGFELQVFL
jgi:hypothetical protein